MLIGREENWSGTVNLPITIILILSALSASLLCAPRAYSYNFPFLIPTLLWLSVEKTALTAVLWISVEIISFATNFSTGAYLIVMAACTLSFLKAHKLAGIATEVE